MEMSEAIVEAVKAGDESRVRDLLAADPALAGVRNSKGESAILQAAYRARGDLVQLLLGARPQLDIFEASATGELGRAKELVESEPGLVNSYADDGFTPLGLASFFGHTAVAEFLIGAGAAVNAASRNEMQVTPLHSAAAGRHAAVAAVLLRNGADPNARQAKGYVPLHSAAATGEEEIVRLLVSHGADVNAKSEDGLTPLQLAVERNHLVVAQVLQEHGAV